MTLRRVVRLFILAVGAAMACACRAPSAPADVAGSALAPAALPSESVSGVQVLLPDGAKISAEAADTPQSRELGLMFRTDLKSDQGMLFFFPHEEDLQFWMENTFIDLDMVFIGADKRVTVVHENVPRSRADTPDGKVARRSGRAQYVLELLAGTARKHGLKAGDRLEFNP